MTNTAAKPVLIGLRADSFIHVGVGQSFGEVDLPFVREPATSFPFIPGSAFKGALRRAYWEKHPAWKLDAEGQKTGEPDTSDAEKAIFGDTDAAAGLLLVGDARLLFLPTRSLGLGFRYLTCPTLLTRAVRDLARCAVDLGEIADVLALRPTERDKAVAATAESPLFIEEYPFTIEKTFDAAASALLKRLVASVVAASDVERDDMLGRIVVVTDDDFDTFARHGLPVRMRNRLNEDKLVETGALWSEEYLPPETLLYAVLADRRAGGGTLDPIGAIRELVTHRGGYLQIGGNETVGQGLCQLAMSGAAS